MAKHNNKGRSSGEPRFVQIPFWVMETDAFRFLSPTAVKVLNYMVKRHDGRNNGKIGFGVRAGCFVKDPATGGLKNVSIGIGQSATADALTELQDAGFIVCEKQSLFVRETDYAEGQRRVREWRLTWIGTIANPMPTKDFVGRAGAVRR